MIEIRRSGRVKGKKCDSLIRLTGSFIVFFVVLSFGLTRGKEDLPPVYKKWLEEDVVYIIKPLEREVFLKLTTDRERDLFIEAFWKQRDPTPGTPDNEFKTEHYRRINYANHFFGRESPKPGWKTDRGRIYIILGEPNDIQRYEGKTQTYPAEVWFYQGKTDVGLPAGFHLIFFQPGGVGEYRLYSPSKDGPQALLTSYYGDPIDYTSAYNQLREFEPELADAAISLIPGESSAMIGRPSLASDLLIQRVETTAQRIVEEKYARKFLEYKDIVEVEYTTNYIDSDGLIKLYREPSGVYFVHLAVEPERLSVVQYEKKYSTTLKMNGSVTTVEGKVIYQFERTMAMNFDEAKLAAISRQPLSIHDMFPLIPGQYRFSVLLKNEVSKEFTTFEQTLQVPEDEPGLQVTSPVLAYKVVPAEQGPESLKPFRFGRFQVYAQPNRAFLQRDTLHVVFQVMGLAPELRDRAELEFVFLRDDVEFRTLLRKMADYSSLPDVREEFPLTEFPPAHYRLKIALKVDGKESLSAEEEFDITHRETINRPWVYSKILPAPADPAYAYILGTQLYNAGKVEAAIVRLEEAYRLRPDSPEIALSLAQAYMSTGEYAGVERLLQPFLESEKTVAYELYFLLGRARQKLGQWDEAIAVFDEAISHYGTNINLLNAVAECYFQKGDARAALTVWEKSLELNPDQPEIRKMVETLKEKK